MTDFADIIGTGLAAVDIGALPDVPSGVTAGSYTSANITVDSKGRITAAATGGGVASSNRLSASLSGTFTSTVVGVWTTITGLSFTYTPSVNERLILATRIRYSHTAAGSNQYFRVTVSPTPAAGPGTFDWSREANTTASTLQSSVIQGICDLTASTAYTFTAQFFSASGAGTLTVSSTVEDTELSAIVVTR